MWHTETPASNESLPASLATQIPTLLIHTSGGRGRGGGGSDKRLMSSIWPICKCRCPPLVHTFTLCIYTTSSSSWLWNSFSRHARFFACPELESSTHNATAGCLPTPFSLWPRSCGELCGRPPGRLPICLAALQVQGMTTNHCTLCSNQITYKSLCFYTRLHLCPSSPAVIITSC
jgi:hypothetical protein